MFTKQGQTHSPGRGAVKSTPPAAANMASPRSSRPEEICLSNADIATKAYEIWLSRGQEAGNDQQHWFEARRQLRQM
jgi:hypothetical protein